VGGSEYDNRISGIGCTMVHAVLSFRDMTMRRTTDGRTSATNAYLALIRQASNKQRGLNFYALVARGLSCESYQFRFHLRSFRHFYYVVGIR